MSLLLAAVIYCTPRLFLARSLALALFCGGRGEGAGGGGGGDFV
jgi:hypothetical protein